MKGYIPSHLKERNSRVIYDLFDDGCCHSKAGISRLTGISAPTVMKIVDSLVEKNILLVKGEGESSVGRKPNLLVRNAKAYYAMGVDFQDGRIRIGLVDLDGRLVAYKESDLVSPAGELLTNTLGALAGSLLGEYGADRSRVLGICLGLPGIVDTENNTVEYAYNIGLNEKTDLAGMMARLEDCLGMPVFIENDVNAAAIGEFRARGLGKDKDLVYISLGFGLGAGLVLNGRLRRGINYFAGEIAYTSFDEKYETGKAPRGWMEEKICGSAQEAIRAENVAPGYIKDASGKIALMLANLSVFLDFELAVLGGLLMKRFSNDILPAIEKSLQGMSMFHIGCSTALSEFPELVGGAATVYEKRLKDVL